MVRPVMNDQILPFGKNLVKISLVDPEIICPKNEGCLSFSLLYSESLDRISTNLRTMHSWDIIANLRFEVAIAIFQCALECQGDEQRWVLCFANYDPKIGCHGNDACANGKRERHITIYGIISTIQWKFGENRFGRSWDNWSESLYWKIN